ncbi:ABC transporter permease [Thermodesulfobacteriota bacterium]
MFKWMKIAFRNILKNKRRSFVTVVAIAIGFAAVGLFKGYTADVYDGLRISAIRGEGLGHLTIYKEGWLENGNVDPDPYMHTKEEIVKIIDLVEEEDEAILATPKIHLSGLVTNGAISTIFLAEGVVPEDDKTIRGSMLAFRPVTGDMLDSKKPYGVEMAEDLAKLLDLRPSMDAVVMAGTLDGQMNALDIQVSGVYDTGVPATNDKFIRFPFDYAQSLYDTQKCEEIIVLLDDWRNTEDVRAGLLDRLRAVGLPCEIKTWNELSVFYTNVRGMMDMIFMFLFFIVFIIVVMSVVNTMGMAVLERTREIGTLRALGLKRKGVRTLFALEGAMIGFFGSILGLVVDIMVWAVIATVRPTYTPPGISSPVPLEIKLEPGVFIVLIAFLVFLSLVAAIIPAKRAARQNVVDALGHV